MKLNDFTNILFNKRYSPIIAIAVTIFAILLILGVTSRKDKDRVKSTEPGGIYYVWISEIIIEEKKKDKSRWDSNSTGPDVSYEIEYKGNKIFKSDIQNDSLVSQWDLVGFDYADKIKEFLGQGSGKIQPTDAIQAGRIQLNYQYLRFHIYDMDPFFSSDKIAVIDIDATKLNEGETSFVFVSNEKHSVDEMTITVVNQDRLRKYIENRFSR